MPPMNPAGPPSLNKNAMACHTESEILAACEFLAELKGAESRSKKADLVFKYIFFHEFQGLAETVAQVQRGGARQARKEANKGAKRGKGKASEFDSHTELERAMSNGLTMPPPNLAGASSLKKNGMAWERQVIEEANEAMKREKEKANEFNPHTELQRAMSTQVCFKEIKVTNIEKLMYVKPETAESKNTRRRVPDATRLANLVTIQNVYAAQDHALSEYSKERRSEPGQYSFYVSGSVLEPDLAGLTVAFRTRPQELHSPWAARVHRGWKIRENDYFEAEAWAIWYALDFISNQVECEHKLKEYPKHPTDPTEKDVDMMFHALRVRLLKASGTDPEPPPKPFKRPKIPRVEFVSRTCCTVRIYSDFPEVLQQIHASLGTSDRSVYGDIIWCVSHLRNYGIKVELHWAPVNMGIPGTELASFVSNEMPARGSACYAF
ncbi:hypothetical protein ACLMJK_008175 [Lecanora helva]